ncbi:MAG TPA: alpha/beta fold hydrolase [Desulfobacteraceae bacterium]|nr:alpha/beta fold hydrolase [Desulfobacteraceae bacterium]
MPGHPHLFQYPFEPGSRLLGNGHRMSYVDEGRGNPVVLLHGNPSWSYLYRNLISLLSRSHRCIAPDHLGCGLSDKPQDYPYRLADHIDNLEDFLEQMAVGGCVLVMHDWGGAIGMGWAARHVEKIAGLVVMNTAAFRSRLLPRRIAVCRLPVLGAFLVRGLNLFARGATVMAVRKKMAPGVRSGFLFPYDSWASRIALHRFVQDIPLNEGHPSWPTLLRVEEGLGTLAGKPMLICWGGRDFCFTEAFYHEWRQRYPDAEGHYFAQAGHYLLEDELNEVGGRINRFLKTIGWTA